VNCTNYIHQNYTGWVVGWKGLKVVSDDLVGFVRELKRTEGPELRTLGSLSLVRQLLVAGLVDRLKLVVCPLILPKTGVEPTFEGLPDMGFDLVSNKVLDGRVLLLVPSQRRYNGYKLAF